MFLNIAYKPMGCSLNSSHQKHKLKSDFHGLYCLLYEATPHKGPVLFVIPLLDPDGEV